MLWMTITSRRRAFGMGLQKRDNPINMTDDLQAAATSNSGARVLKSDFFLGGFCDTYATGAKLEAIHFNLSTVI